MKYFPHKHNEAKGLLGQKSQLFWKKNPKKQGGEAALQITKWTLLTHKVLNLFQKYHESAKSETLYQTCTTKYYKLDSKSHNGN